MKFEHVGIRNFRSHSDTELSLRSGVTVIHGVNGSGKSSLLEACFFALYGSAAIEGTLDDAIANGAEEMSVTLSFTHDGAEYRVEREVKLRGDTAQTTICVLETPDGPIEQVTDVENRIESLLRMDADAFVNCAYVRQGEVNKLINASPGERQDMIDDLLQLGTLETYRERASDARVGVKRVRDRKRELLADRERSIETKEDKDLTDRLNGLEAKRTELTEEIEQKAEQRDTAEETLADAEATIDEYEQRRSQIESLESDIEELTETIAAAERERDDLEDQIRSLRETVESREEELNSVLSETDLEEADPEAIGDRIDALADETDDVRERIEARRLGAQSHTNDAENARERAAELRERAETKRERATELEAEIESDRAKLEERTDRVEKLDEQIESLSDTLKSAPVDREELEAHHKEVREERSEAGERLAELRAELKNARERVQEAEGLLEAGKCPECGQPVDGSPHVDRIGDDRERVTELEAEVESVETEIESLDATVEKAEDLRETATDLEGLVETRENVGSLIEQRRESITETTERVETLRTEADEHESEAEGHEKKADEHETEAEEARKSIGELNQEKARLDESRERFEQAETLLDEVSDAEGDIETLRDRRAKEAELNDQRRERLTDKRDRKAELEDGFDEDALEEAIADRDRAEKYLSKVEPYLDEKHEARDELQNEIGAVRNELDELDALREQRAALAATVEGLESLYDEAARLQEMYAELRHELRQRNVDRLEAVLNETFDLVYQNDSYARIELDGEYELTVYQKDGTPLDPDQLSGGERALFNLSLRCAIYRLLTEGIDGQAPTPPLILDEPTVFLDSGHVSKLVELIGSMTDHGVAQIIVVSHDEELVGAADDLIAVRKDPTTNRSSVERSATTEALS